MRVETFRLAVVGQGSFVFRQAIVRANFEDVYGFLSWESTSNEGEWLYLGQTVRETKAEVKTALRALAIEHAKLLALVQEVPLDWVTTSESR